MHDNKRNRENRSLAWCKDEWDDSMTSCSQTDSDSLFLLYYEQIQTNSHLCIEPTQSPFRVLLFIIFDDLPLPLSRIYNMAAAIHRTNAGAIDYSLLAGAESLQPQLASSSSESSSSDDEADSHSPQTKQAWPGPNKVSQVRAAVFSARYIVFT